MSNGCALSGLDTAACRATRGDATVRGDREELPRVLPPANSRQTARMPCPRALLCPRLVLAFAAALLAGCAPSVGDRCALSTDCSIQGTRICDTSQPNGYCTVQPCAANSCPDNAACVEFAASLPGCPYDDYGAPSRVGRAMCMKTCASSSDCRQSEGYVCTNPQNPWTVILERNQSRQVCVFVAPGSAAASYVDAAVCSSKDRPDATPLDAQVTGLADSEAGPSSDASVDVLGDGPADASGDRPVDVFIDAPVDVFEEAPVDAPVDAFGDEFGDAPVDALDSAPDSGATDATGGS